MQKFICWAPRILSILFILFLAMFSLDVFSEELNLWQTLLGLFMHNIPSLILTVILIVSWKYEIVGGIGYMLAGMLYIGLIVKNSLQDGFHGYYITWSIIITGPAFLVGVLFLLSWINKRKRNPNKQNI